MSVPVVCSENEACDPLDGVCKPIESLVPCVAVIDESAFPTGPSNATFDGLWRQFRTEYPNRPFCLLRPECDPRGSCADNVPFAYLYLPPDFLADPRTIFSEVTREASDGSGDVVGIVPGPPYSDWFDICQLDRLSSTGIEFIGVFIDESGSMTRVNVANALAAFESRVAAQGLTIRRRENDSEDWVTPFITDLVPST